MNIIVAVDNEWGIGNKDSLLVTIRADLRNFAGLTKGKTVVYGSKTLATFPGKEPLKGRRNIILSRRPGFKVEGAEIASSVDEVLSLLKNENSDDVFIIGGGSIYKQFLDHCDMCYVTKIAASFEKDVYFPDIDNIPGWKLVYRSAERKSDPETDGTGDIAYFFTKYRRITEKQV